MNSKEKINSESNMVIDFTGAKKRFADKESEYYNIYRDSYYKSFNKISSLSEFIVISNKLDELINYSINSIQELDDIFFRDTVFNSKAKKINNRLNEIDRYTFTEFTDNLNDLLLEFQLLNGWGEELNDRLRKWLYLIVIHFEIVIHFQCLTEIVHYLTQHGYFVELPMKRGDFSNFKILEDLQIAKVPELNEVEKFLVSKSLHDKNLAREVLNKYESLSDIGHINTSSLVSLLNMEREIPIEDLVELKTISNWIKWYKEWQRENNGKK